VHLGAALLLDQVERRAGIEGLCENLPIADHHRAERAIHIAEDVEERQVVDEDITLAQPQTTVAIDEVSVNFKAPTQAGVFVSSWQLANANGTPFPRTFYVKIVVK
jgi:hypothetical protein